MVLQGVQYGSMEKLNEIIEDMDNPAANASNPSEFQSFIENPGFQHIVERIFLNLKYEDLLTCRLINKPTKLILDNPLIWLKKWRIQGNDGLVNRFRYMLIFTFFLSQF